MNQTSRLLTTTEIAALLHRAERTIQTWGLKWEQAAREMGDPYIPSSPAKGLRRSGASTGRAMHDQRDVDEYVENAVREVIGQPLQNWRKEVRDEVA